MNTHTRLIIIRVITLIGILINLSYAIKLLCAFFSEENTQATQEILISAIALEFSWTILLIWVLFKPFERRQILLLTAVPLLMANILHSLNQLLYFETAISTIFLNLSIGIAFAMLFVFAYWLGK